MYIYFECLRVESNYTHLPYSVHFIQKMKTNCNLNLDLPPVAKGLKKFAKDAC